jgi:hypothetical protein
VTSDFAFSAGAPEHAHSENASKTANRVEAFAFIEGSILTLPIAPILGLNCRPSSAERLR